MKFILNQSDTPVQFFPLFFTFTPNLQSTITRDAFFDSSNVPPAGYVWISSQQTDNPQSGIQQVVAIKFSDFDANGTEVVGYLDDFTDLRIIFSDAALPYDSLAAKYIVTGRTVYSNHVVCNVSQELGNNIFQEIGSSAYYPITSSQDGGSMNWSMQGGTTKKTGPAVSQSSDLLQLNRLTNYTTTGQQQIISVFNSSANDIAKVDPLGFLILVLQIYFHL